MKTGRDPATQARIEAGDLEIAGRADWVRNMFIHACRLIRAGRKVWFAAVLKTAASATSTVGPTELSDRNLFKTRGFGAMNLKMWILARVLLPADRSVRRKAGAVEYL